METEQLHLDNLRVGLDNLLWRGARIKAGERLLIVGEVGNNPYYDKEICVAVAQVARENEVHTKVVYAAPVTDAASISQHVVREMLAADVTLFFSRLGDQLRFIPSPGKGRKVMCYTLTQAHLRSSFATLDHDKLVQMLQILENLLHSSSHYRITTCDGTNLTGEITSDVCRSPSKAFQVDLFPVMIFEPINCHQLAGDLMVSRFITSTSTRAYDDSVLIIDTPIKVRIEDSVITSMHGDRKTIRLFVEQLERAAQLSGGDPYVLHSWHTGVNPGAFFVGNPFDDLEYWGTVAYGSPRYTHIHAAGLDPGDIAYHLFDTTIWFDNEIYWQDGRFLFLDRPEIRALFSPQEQTVLNSTYRLDIGL